MEHLRRSPHHFVTLGLIRRLLTPFFVFQKHWGLGRGRTNTGLHSSHDLDVYDEVYQVAGPLYPIPGGFLFVAGLDSLRLSSRPDQSLRHALFKRGTLCSPIDNANHKRFDSAGLGVHDGTSVPLIKHHQGGSPNSRRTLRQKAY